MNTKFANTLKVLCVLSACILLLSVPDHFDLEGSQYSSDALPLFVVAVAALIFVNSILILALLRIDRHRKQRRQQNGQATFDRLP